MSGRYEFYCLETNCARWARSLGHYKAPGWGPKGPILVWFDRRECEDGHRYMVEIFEEEVKQPHENRG